MDAPSTYFDALSNLLRAEGWQTTVRTFVHENAPLFDLKPGQDYDHRHHGLWVEFRELAESLLESMLIELGGSLSQLEKQIDERVEAVPAGPRAASEQEVLTDLMSFCSFETFVGTMQQRHREIEFAAAAKDDDNSDHSSFEQQSAEETFRAPSSHNHSSPGEDECLRLELEQMGFSSTAIALAIHEAGTSDNKALQWLLDNPDAGKAAAKSDDIPSPRRRGTVGWDHATRARSQEKTQQQEDGEELAVQAAIARSILQANDNGSLSGEEKTLVPWARSVEELEALVLSHAQRRRCGTRLSQEDLEQFAAASSTLRSRLRVEKLRADLVVARALAAENDQLRSALAFGLAPARETSELNNGTDAHEDEIARLLRRSDELYKETAKARKPVAVFSKPPHSIDKDALEESYLYLRDLVHNRVDLPSRRAEIDAFVVQERIGEEAAYHSGLLPKMLALMGLEDELVIVSQRVRMLLNPGCEIDRHQKDGMGDKKVASSQKDISSPETLVSTLDLDLERLNQMSEAREAMLLAAVECSGMKSAEQEALRFGFRSGSSARHQALTRNVLSGDARNIVGVFKPQATLALALKELANFKAQDTALQKALVDERNHRLTRVLEIEHSDGRQRFSERVSVVASTTGGSVVEVETVGAALSDLDTSLARISAAARAPKLMRLYAALAGLAASLETTYGNQSGDILVRNLVALWEIHSHEDTVLKQSLRTEQGRQRKLLLGRRVVSRQEKLTCMHATGASAQDMDHAAATMRIEDRHMLARLSNSFDSQSRLCCQALHNAQLSEISEALGLVCVLREDSGSFQDDSPFTLMRGWENLPHELAEGFDEERDELDISLDEMAEARRDEVQRLVKTKRFESVARLRELSESGEGLCTEAGHGVGDAFTLSSHLPALPGAPPVSLVAGMSEVVALEAMEAQKTEMGIAQSASESRKQLLCWHRFCIAALIDVALGRGQVKTESTSTSEFKDVIGRDRASSHLSLQLTNLETELMVGARKLVRHHEDIS